MATKTTANKTKRTRSKPIARKEVVINYPSLQVPSIMRPLQGFVDFLREQGVVGLAVGFVLGAQSRTLVDSLVNSFINPLLGLILPGEGSLREKSFSLTLNGKTADFTWGSFVFQLITFIIVAAFIYFIIRGLKLDKLDKKKA